MIKSLLVILTLSLVGDAIADRFGALVPGSAIGLLCLIIHFSLLGQPDQGSAKLFDAAAPHFPLFFVPAAVGVVASMEVLRDAWVLFLLAIVVSTTAAILVTGIVAQLMLRAQRKEIAT